MNNENDKNKLVNGDNIINAPNGSIIKNEDTNIIRESSIPEDNSINNVNEGLLTFQIPEMKENHINNNSANNSTTSNINNTVPNIVGNNITQENANNILNIVNETPNSIEENTNLTIKNLDSNFNNSNQNEQKLKENYLTSMIDSQKEQKDINDEEIVKKIMGEEYYNKFTKEVFNVAVFFFPTFYMYYTGLFFWGVMLCIFTCVLNLSFGIIVRLLLGFLFNRLYIERVRRKVRDSKSSGLVGGNISCNFSWHNVLVGMFINFLIIAVFGTISLVAPLFSANSNNILTKLYETINENVYIENNNEFDINDTVEKDTSINLYNLIEISIPNEFTKVSNYSYMYGYDISDNDSSKCSMSIFVVSNYNNEDELLDTLESDYKLKNNGKGYISIKSSTSNTDDWKELYFKLDEKEDYYYVKLNNNKLYMFTYIIEKNASDSCSEYREDILESIEFK